jgi:uncharacterized protein
VAMENNGYYSAARSLWDDTVNRKSYVTGGVGSGETSEGFGVDYSLPNNAYCESCSSCGAVFFASKMNLIWQDAAYADFYETTLYNAILGSVDLAGENFTYTNPLDSREARYKWHACPCCIGNIPRTLLMLPSWMYARDEKNIFVNLYMGSTVALEDIAGTRVELTQTTDYPWDGNIALTINPARSKRFTLRLRIPNRQTGPLYTAAPACNGLLKLNVNGQPVEPVIKNGYAVINRKWKAGDRVELGLPLKVQRIKADPRVLSDAGKTALAYGPLIYNIESVDHNTVDGSIDTAAELTTGWNAGLLDGVRVINGKFADGTPLMAIPNYARLNRGGRSVVWINEK